MTCRDCLTQPAAAYDRVVAPFEFTGGVREALHLVKYQGRRRLTAHVAAAVSAFARRHLLDDAFTVVLPVPLNWQRLWRRGFNQAEWFAAPVADELGVPLETTWLTRRQATPSQTTRTRAQRLANLEGAFAVTATGAARLPDARVLLVDDIVTTGATADACARALQQAGAAHITVLAAAVTPRAT